MSQGCTDGTKSGPGFDAVGVSTADDQDYPNEWEMEDTASSSVKVVGKVVPETDVSSFGTESAGRTYCGRATECDGSEYGSGAESRRRGIGFK